MKKKISLNNNQNQILFLEDKSELSEAELSSLRGIAEENGREAAKQLNSIVSNTQAFQQGLREVLNVYYSNNDTLTTYDKFTENITEEAYDMIKDYEDAKSERLRANELDYSVDKILVTFSADISENAMKEVVESLDGDINSTTKNMKVFYLQNQITIVMKKFYQMIHY